MADIQSNLANFLNDINVKNASSLQGLGDAIGAVADIAGAVSGIGGAISLVSSLIGQGDQAQAQLQQILATIQQDFEQLQAADKAGRIIDRLTNQVNAQGDAEKVLDSLNALLNAQPPLTDAQRVDEIENCIAAIEKLSPEIPIWTAVFSDQIYWTDSDVYMRPDPFGLPTVDVGYGLQAPPGSADDLVFSYTYILSAYLQALFCFLTVAGALRPTFAKDYADSVLRPAATLLKARHDKIVNEGIKQLFPPHWDGRTLLEWTVGPPAAPVYQVGITPLSTTDPLTTLGASIEYGAVEQFSGSSAMADYKMPFSPVFGSDSTDPAPYVKFLIRVLRKAKQVYVQVGLRTLWTIINNVNQLVGDPPLPRPNFGDWSFREIVATAAKGQLLPPEPTPISLMVLARMLTQTPPLDTLSIGAVAGGVVGSGGSGPPLTTSFRNLLEPPET